jgi:CheY-like chemotaxis protein
VTTIVLADDDDDLRAVYAACLGTAGYTVVEAADGQQTVALVRARRPELLLLDIWMPGFNGFEVLDALRHDPAAARLKVVMLSSQSDADARLEAFGAGAVAYLIKGLGLADLLDQVRRALERAEVIET